ncbi:hypothetical protein B0O99DRAFT_599425 [Bisporella sp. PMI_857]|nr:hypothetical protein B0O99DRAFT_599425 [Bisporella sp. PMI_857]
MSVWTLPGLRLIYRLASGNEYERDLEDASGMAESFATTKPVICQDTSSQSKCTTFSAGPDGLYYCCGKEGGSVIIYESLRGDKVRKICNHAATSTVISLTWSDSGRFIVSSDDSSRAICKRISLKESGQWAVFPRFDIRVNGAVQQFVFNTKNRVWKLKEKIEVYYQLQVQGSGGKWIADPMNHEVLLYIEHDKVCIYTWSTMQSVEPDSVTPSSNVKANLALRGGTLTEDKRNIVNGILHANAANLSQISICLTSSLSHSWHTDLSGQCKRLIGTMDNSIVFLNHDYWICTWGIEASSSDIKRHFFLPRDWVNPSTLQMTISKKNGTFFCLRSSSVIITRNGIRL